MKSILQRWRQRRAIGAWQRSPLGQALAQHTAEYFSKNPRLAAFDSATKQQHISAFYQEVASVSGAGNPFLAMRERLASYVYSFAEYQVWCLTEDEKETSFYSSCPYITGTLHASIQQAIPLIDDLGEAKRIHPEITDAELVDYCNSRCALCLYYLNGLNIVRGELNDINAERDWLRPFMQSMLIWLEDDARHAIGKDSLLPGSADALKNSIFMNIVKNGHTDPLSEWEKVWRGEGT